MRLSDLFDTQSTSIAALLAQQSVELITADSREAAKGVLFFAIRGTSRDGHDFVKEVLQKGAVAVVERGFTKALPREIAPHAIEVPDTRKALGWAASRFYGDPSAALKMCAVTGTNGKTTTTFLLEAVLKAQGLNPAVIGTIENRLGGARVPSTHTTPDAVSLQRTLADFRDRGARSVAIEVSSHALDQSRTWGTQFESAIFTNQTQDHLDYHSTMENYFAAKSKLFLEYPVKIRAIHGDDPWGRRLVRECERRGFGVITFGRTGCAVNTTGLVYSEKGISGEVTIDWQGTKTQLRLHSPLLGGFNGQNLAGVVAAAFGMGVPAETIAHALATVEQVPGRLERVANRKNLTVVVDYAHTPDALENVLNTLRPLCRGKLICVFGCGGDRDAGKRPVMGAIAQKLADQVFVTSDNPRTEDPEKIINGIVSGFHATKLGTAPRFHRITDRSEAIHKALAAAHLDDIVLIAGKGHEDYQIIGTVKHKFDDREVVREILNHG